MGTESYQPEDYQTLQFQYKKITEAATLGFLALVSAGTAAIALAPREYRLEDAVIGCSVLAAVAGVSVISDLRRRKDYQQQMSRLEKELIPV